MRNELALNPSCVAHLAFADGATWDIVPGNERASALVSTLVAAMQLGPPAAASKTVQSTQLTTATTGHEEPPSDPDHRLVVLGSREAVSLDSPPSRHEHTVTCIVGPVKDGDVLGAHLVRISTVIATFMEARGGLLLHAALLERDGLGVILAGRGGVGKTTATRRLPSYWKSLCDDTTFIVRDKDGTYWAHPWPTWSKFMNDGPGGTWDVHHAIPIAGIFFLNQSGKDVVEPLGSGRAACMLMESVEQVSWPMMRGMKQERTRQTRLQRFNNACQLAVSLPCHVLRISRTGTFYHLIEEAINGGSVWGGKAKNGRI